MVGKKQASSIDTGGKQCSICGKLYDHAEFSYRNKENRSYCRSCDKEEMAERKKGGNESAREYRENKRGEWTTTG